MKLTVKLLVLIAILVAVAGLCGGWKWDALSGKRKAADYALVAVDPNSSADPNGSASSPRTDAPSTLAPADPAGSVTSTPADTSFIPDGWTWD